MLLAEIQICFSNIFSTSHIQFVMDISCNSNIRRVFLHPLNNTLYKSRKMNIVKCSSTSISTSGKKKSTNLYEILSLESCTVSSDEIKKAYKSMARQHHPDVVPTSRKEESTKRFVELQRDYETLSNPVSRQKYDCELRLGGATFCLMKEEKLRNISKDVWESQLEGLKQRPHGRVKRSRGI